ncbi:MAG: HAMP domain-containing protein [Magnetococcales bacterium]|nr:HAMP domain-containing protein [Magnetococcales bacterium]
MRLATMRISTKLAFIIAFTLCSFVLVTALYTFILQHSLTQNQQVRDREMRIEQLANEVVIQMLQARRGEKDFLLRKEKALVDSVVVAAQAAIQQANAIIPLSQQGRHAVVESKASQIVQAMKLYLEAFQNLANGHAMVGLGPELGLQGQFRQASHALEALLPNGEVETLRDHLYRIARWEVAYLLGNRTAESLQLLADSRRLIQQLADSAVSSPWQESLKEALAALVSALQQRLESDTNRPDDWAATPLHGRIMALETLVDQHYIPAALVTYLALRRAEKDYLLRHDSRDAQEVHMVLQRLQDKIAHSRWSEEEKKRGKQLLADYTQAFDALLSQDIKNGVLLSNMRAAVHPVEQLSEEIRATAAALATAVASETQLFGERAAVILLLFSLLTVAICGVVCALIIRSISRSLQDLQQFAKEVAQGRWEALVPVEGGDEIGQLAEQMRIMVHRMRANRLLTDRLVLTMVLIGRGILPEKLDGVFQGDFKVATEALNHMIDTLAVIQQVTRRLEQLDQGVIPEKWDPVVSEGAFKEMVVAMNRVIDLWSAVGSKSGG